jgi:hypothetical protein
MAMIHSPSRLYPGAALRNGSVDEVSVARLPNSSDLRTRSAAVRRLLGLAFLLLGILMVFTLMLLPVGAPLSLLAVAMIAAPSDR